MPDDPVCGHLAVVSHVVHHRWHGRVYAYTPYAREIDQWASMVDQLTVVAPVRDGEPPDDTAVLLADNVTLAPQIEAGGDDRRAKLAQLARLPAMVLGVDRAIRTADAVQVRCPGNLGLIGAVVAPLRSRRVMAKYAGQWRGFEGEPRAWRLQRAILRSRWFRGPVLAYGPAEGDRRHVVPAFSSAVDAATLARAAAVADSRSSRPRPGGLRVLFVGRLTAAKHVDAVIEAVRSVASTGVKLTLRVVGDGPERASLQALAERGEVAVDFVGAVDQQKVFEEYAAADVLVLASASEGWPKAIAEAMAFGAVCVGNDRGMVPAMLGEGRGFTVAPGDAPAVARVLAALAADADDLERRAGASAAWASRFSLDEFESEMRRVLGIAWNEGSRWMRPPAIRGAVALAAPERSGPASLRVLQVVDSLAVGGAEQIAVHLANELARSGHQSALVATRAAGPLAEAIERAVWWQSLRRTGRFDLRAIGALRSIVAARRIDVVHAHSTSVFLVAAAFAVGPRPAIVWHDHTSAAAKRNPWPLRVVGRWVDVAVAVSHDIETADRRRLWLADRLVLVPNFSVLDVGDVPATGLPGATGSRIVCVANLRPVKDQVTVVRAMAAVLRNHPEAHLLLVGSDTGSYADHVRDEITRLGVGANVTLLGVRTDVGAVLAGCDIGVLGSLEEGTPLAVLEYGLSGLAVVATAVGEVVELLGRSDRSTPHQSTAGVLVEPGDAEGIAGALGRLLDDVGERQRLGSQLRDRIQAEYSAAAVLSRWERVYRSALARRAAIDAR